MAIDSLTLVVNFIDGKRDVDMLPKQQHEIADCEVGKVVCLNLFNGETHTGFFNGMDGDEDIMLRSLSGKHTLGYKVAWVKDYFEQQ